MHLRIWVDNPAGGISELAIATREDETVTFSTPEAARLESAGVEFLYVNLDQVIALHSGAPPQPSEE